MKKRTVLRSAILTTGIFTGSLTLQAQSGTGAAAGGGVGGTAAGVGTSAAGAARAGAISSAPGSVVGTRSGVTTAPRAGTVSGGVATGVQGAGTSTAATAGNLHTVGASSITTPSASAPVGAASVIGNSPNVVGGSVNGGSFISPAPTASGQAVNASGALPGGGNVGQSIPVTAVPVPVQGALRGYTANGMLGSITQIQGLNGPIYRASVTQNGVPMELQIAPTGQVLTQTPLTGNAGVGSAGIIGNSGVGTALSADAGLPFNSLPAAVQSGVTTQLGANSQIQSVSRDDLANGTVFRVTALQNGVPTEMRFAANGTLLGSTPVSGATTSVYGSGTPLVFDTLPVAIQGAIRDEVGDARINRITSLQGTNGLSYVVSYDQNGRPMTMIVGPDGRIHSNPGANTAIGRSGAATTGRGSSTNSPARHTNTNSRVSLKLEDLPDSVSSALKKEAKYSEVRYINREQRVGGDIYTVGLRNEDNVGELTISADGKILNDTRRDLSQLAIAKPAPDNGEFEGIPFSKVPVAIQDAIKAYAPASDIRSISLDLDRDGKTVYDVVYYNDGRRDKLVLAKDGSVKRIDRNVSPVAETAVTARPPVLAIGDLPPVVRDTIERQTENVRIKDIGTRQIGSQTVYRVSYEKNGTPVELLVGMDGVVVRPQGSPLADLANSPLPAPITKDEENRARVVKIDSPTVKPEEVGSAALGTPARAEKGANNSSGNSTDSVAAVALSDVPPAVQTAAKRLAGNSQIHSISPHLKDSGMVYEISYGDPKQTASVNKDGKIQQEKK